MILALRQDPYNEKMRLRSEEFAILNSRIDNEVKFKEDQLNALKKKIHILENRSCDCKENSSKIPIDENKISIDGTAPRNKTLEERVEKLEELQSYSNIM